VPKIQHHPEHDKQLGRRLAAFRKARNITQIDLAQRLGITQGGLSKYERGQLRIHSELLRQLADAVGVSTDELLGVPAKPARPIKLSAEDREAQRLWKKFQLVMELPEKDRRAVIRLVNSLVELRPRKAS
jgi:transcriptional regulator with XRE-family HTH domain